MRAPPAPRAAIVGIAGPTLTDEEILLFRRTPPLGVILFARNIQDPPQLAALTAKLRELLGPETPILVDQEGGRVARLRPPHWLAYPPAAAFERAPAAVVRANASLIGLDCAASGIDVVCGPVLDLRLPDAHGVIGDRAFSADPAEVVRLGRAFAAGLRAAGCTPVLKHIPGHGRALADSHHELPCVGVDRGTLADDLLPFAALAESPGVWAMTAHILYPAIDAERCATLSPRVIQQVIRGEIGFHGVLISDDLAMGALSGAPAELARAALAAGCDIALHCTGRLAETAAVLSACPTVSDAAAERLAASREAVAEASRMRLDPVVLRSLRDGWLAAPVPIAAALAAGAGRDTHADPPTHADPTA
ncbi:beta-hexosaminidase [Caldovatus sediminis]|uniref:beta-N-acetylhexosaminidase n=1 Tax=Caldovatus sediminis TaxID=2041189 RepID=A0A8J3EE65_9PROT|nr:beta-N-acetylhexosaminidase [Caldovatus sediminis]GGG51119.1 beta-hexosaminidase [Caldovatus sediminis]